MKYNDSIDDSKQYLQLALQHIGKHGLPMSPVNYWVWYEYVSGKNSQLNEMIDHNTENRIPFSNDTIRQLYNQYIAGEREKVTTLVCKGLEGVLSDITSASQATQQNFSESENKLESIGNTMAPTLSQADVARIVLQLKSEIQELESSSSSFRDQLDQATHEINQLRNKMQKYRKEVLMDQLTSLGNRRGFDERMALAINNSNQVMTDLCLIMADIDHFKRVNDTHGHLVGDNVLRVAASTIKETIKGKDYPARIGGEEFAVILSETPLEGAIKLANNIRLAFEHLDLKKKSTGESLGRITLSLGVTNYLQGEPSEDFFNRADEALYQSKNKGRNRVTGVKG